MRAYALVADGAEAAFHDVPCPVAAEGEVLVRVAAASLNPHDAAVRSGDAARYMNYRYPVVLGSDFAGVIEAVGEGVNDLQPGDRVFGLVRELVAARGSLAPLVAVPRDWVAVTPPSLSDADAGVLGLAALGALRCTDAIEPLSAGQVVLVNGATGGIGGYVIQLLAERGVHVIATSRAGEEEEYVRALGAAETVNWKTADLPVVVASRHPSGVDAIVDLVTPDHASLTRLARAILRRGGRLVSTRHAVALDDLPDMRGENLLITVDGGALNRIARHAASGVLEAPHVTTFDFETVEDAFDAMGAGIRGKIAVRLAHHSRPKN